MDVFPFSQLEWQEINDIAHSLVNATFANDSVLQASLYEELLAVLDKLRGLHGDHPILRETAADFCDDPLLQVDMYRSAIWLAETNELPTLTIRISLASVLLEDFHDSTQAAHELAACESELATQADESQMGEWTELMRQCARKEE